MTNKKQILLAIPIYILLFHIFGFSGHFGFDDIEYARLANGLNHGYFEWNNHYFHRFTIISLTSIFYYCLDINQWSSALPTMLVAVFILWLLFKFIKKEKSFYVLFIIALTACSNWWIFYTDKLMPDMYICLSVLIAVYLLHRKNFKTSYNSYSNGIGLGIITIIGFLSKGSFILFTPVVLYLLIKDLLAKQHKHFWLSFIVSSSIMSLAYFAMMYIQTGDALIRFAAIDKSSYANPCQFMAEGFKNVIHRLSLGYIDLLVSSGIIVPFIFVFASINYSSLKSIFKTKYSYHFFRLLSILALISSNFMTISWHTYNPMCIDPRHYLFLIPIGSLGALHFFKSKNANKNAKLIGFLLIAGLWSFRINNTLFFKIYLPLFIASYLYAYKSNWKFLSKISLIVALFIQPIAWIRYASKVDYEAQRKFTSVSISNLENITLYSHSAEKNIYNYDQKFKDQNIDWKNIDSIEKRDKNLNNYILENSHSRKLSHEKIVSLKDLKLELICADKSLSIFLYKVLD